MTTTSSILDDYYARERRTLATEPAVRAELLAAGVAVLTAEYDGVGDSGQIEDACYFGDVEQTKPAAVDTATDDRVSALLYALLEIRHAGWEINDGAFGTFTWNLIDGTMDHDHSQRFTDHESTSHEGFDVERDSEEQAGDA